MNNDWIEPDCDTARKVIAEQFPDYADLPITDIEKQGHDNRTYKLGKDMLIRMPTSKNYALKVAKEHELLPQLAKNLTITIPTPIKMGTPSKEYPYPFSIYTWLPGKSLNLIDLNEEQKEKLACDLADFLKELHAITNMKHLEPGQHNWWRGDHLRIYDKGAREQISHLSQIIDGKKALDLWEKACRTQWEKKPVWIHGDYAIGNMIINNCKLSSIIDFGGCATGDPACDLVIYWTYLNKQSRNLFMSKMNLDDNTWLRASAWALWKATFELCHISNKKSFEAHIQQNIIFDILNHYQK